MTRSTRLTVLVENTAGDDRLLAEHGFSCWIEAAGRRLLFDTGQGPALEHNARLLDVPLNRADAIVVSHGHYDHTGGLAFAMDQAGRTPVFLNPAAAEPKFARMPDGAARPIGLPDECLARVRSRPDRLVLVTRPTALPGGLVATGPIPRRTDFENPSAPFFLDRACTRPDPLGDDQAVFFDGPAGTVVVLGCAHAGVINTLQYVRELTRGRPIHTVLGGMHLLDASDERLRKTVEALRALGPERIGPCHCTGEKAVALIRDSFPEQFLPCPTGAIVL